MRDRRCRYRRYFDIHRAELEPGELHRRSGNRRLGDYRQQSRGYCRKHAACSTFAVSIRHFRHRLGLPYCS